MYNISFNGFGTAGAFTTPGSQTSASTPGVTTGKATSGGSGYHPTVGAQSGSSRFTAAGPQRKLTGTVRMSNGPTTGGSWLPPQGFVTGGGGTTAGGGGSTTGTDQTTGGGTTSTPGSDAGTQTLPSDGSGGSGPLVQPLIGSNGAPNTPDAPVPAKKGLPWWSWTLIAVGGAGALGGTIYAVVKRRRG